MPHHAFAAGIGGVAVRLTMGWAADREGARPVVAFATAAPTPMLVVGALALIGGGWGWTGLAFLSVVRANPAALAAAAGVVLTGLGAGGPRGPLAFGAVADRASFTVAWTLAAAALAAASITVRSAHGSLHAPTPSSTDRPA